MEAIRNIDYILTYITSDFKVLRREYKQMEIICPITIINEFMHTPKQMKFIYAMMQAEENTYQLPQHKYEYAKENLTWLIDFDPHNEYTLNDEYMTITKTKRKLKPAEGEVAELETYFLNDKSIKQRQRIVFLLDDIKRFGETPDNLNLLRSLIKPQLSI